MKTYRHIFILVFLFFFMKQSSFAQYSWLQKANFVGGKRSCACGFAIGSKGYVGTGSDSVYNLHSDFWEYNTDSDFWIKKADFPGAARWGAVAFSIGTKGYIVGGRDNQMNYFTDIWEYDPIVNSWTAKANFPGQGRFLAVGFSIGTKGYIGTGSYNSNKYLNDFWEFNSINNSWTRKADFAGAPRQSATGFNIGNKGYIGTGEDNTNLLYNDFWEYDTLSNLWSQKPSIPTSAREGSIGFCIGNKGYVGMGLDDYYIYAKTNDLWEYNSLTNAWSRKDSCQGFKSLGAICFSIGNKAYVGTGEDSSQAKRNDFYEYTPTPTGISETQKQNEFSIYPNPASGNIFIQSSSPIIHCEITDVSGRQVYQGTPQQNKNLLEINLCVPDGIYFIKIITRDGIGNRKVVVRN